MSFRVKIFAQISHLNVFISWVDKLDIDNCDEHLRSQNSLIDLNNIRWLLENAIAINPGWEKGSLYAAMMSVHLNDLSGDKDSERRALEYFELADRAAKGYNIGIYVTLAESFAVSKQDKAYFLELIDKALTIDISKDKDMKQANTLSKLRAAWLLTRVDDLFYM